LNAFFTPLVDESVLSIHGPDTLAFLQGQTTCDTRDLSEGQALQGLLCSPQGRVLADFLAVQIAPEHVLLRLRRGIAADTTAILSKYIAFSKAELTDQSRQWQAYGLHGDDAQDCLAQSVGASARGSLAVVTADGAFVVQLDEKGECFECLASSDSPAIATLSEAAAPGTEAAWRARLITHGLPRIEAETAGEFVPQNLNFDRTGHISFTKGCYTGQEVVARLHYRGKSKRRVLVGRTSTGSVDTGQTVVTADGKTAGVVINAAGIDEDASVLLVSTSPDNVDQGLQLAETSSPISLALPPYSLED